MVRKYLMIPCCKKVACPARIAFPCLQQPLLVKVIVAIVRDLRFLSNTRRGKALIFGEDISGLSMQSIMFDIRSGIKNVNGMPTIIATQAIRLNVVSAGLFGGKYMLVDLATAADGEAIAETPKRTPLATYKLLELIWSTNLRNIHTLKRMGFKNRLLGLVVLPSWHRIGGKRAYFGCFMLALIE